MPQINAQTDDDLLKEFRHIIYKKYGLNIAYFNNIDK